MLFPDTAAAAGLPEDAQMDAGDVLFTENEPTEALTDHETLPQMEHGLHSFGCLDHQRMETNSDGALTR